MSPMDIMLAPHSCDNDKSFCIDERQWRRAVSLVETTYRGNTCNGLDRPTTRHFVAALRQALQQGRARAEDVAELTSLVSFLEGAGAGGTRLTRNYKRWDRA